MGLASSATLETRAGPRRRRARTLIMKKTKPKIIAVASLKGGVGKTTIAVNLAGQLAAQGLRVLFADLDPSGNGSDFFVPDDADTLDRVHNSNVYHYLTNGRGIEDTKYAAANLDVLPTTLELARLAADTAGNPAPLLSFRAKLQKESYDVVIIDTPPYLGADFRAAIWAADLVLSPIAPRRWIYAGVAMLAEQINTVHDVTGRKAPPLWLVASLVGTGEADSLKLAGLAAQYHLVTTKIIKMKAIEGAIDSRRHLMDGSKASQLFADLAIEIRKIL